MACGYSGGGRSRRPSRNPVINPSIKKSSPSMPPLPPIVWIAIALVILLLGDDFGDKFLGSTPLADQFLTPDRQLVVFGLIVAGIVVYALRSGK